MAKVAHLTSVHPPRDVRIQKECQTLAQAGYEVALIVPTDQDELVGEVRLCGVPKSKGRARRMVGATWRVYRRARKMKPDLYHIHDPELLPWAQLLRVNGKSVIYDMHENMPGAILFKDWLPFFMRRPIHGLYRIVERSLLTGLNVIFAETSYQELYPSVRNAETILNMPMADRLSKIREPKYANPTVGYMGAVGPSRGSLVTAEALRLLKESGREVHWECLGRLSARHREELTSRVAAYGLKEVNVRGYTLPEEGWAIMARCHVGLALLKATPNYVESYPTKIFEYMALGLPIVASHFPLYRHVIEGAKCGLCVDPEDPMAIAAAISWLLEHPAEARAMGERGLRAVMERYNWDSQARKLLVFYDTLLKDSG